MQGNTLQRSAAVLPSQAAFSCSPNGGRDAVTLHLLHSFLEWPETNQ